MDPKVEGTQGAREPKGPERTEPLRVKAKVAIGLDKPLRERKKTAWRVSVGNTREDMIRLVNMFQKTSKYHQRSWHGWCDRGCGLWYKGQGRRDPNKLSTKQLSWFMNSRRFNAWRDEGYPWVEEHEKQEDRGAPAAPESITDPEYDDGENEQPESEGEEELPPVDVSYDGESTTAG